MQKTPRLAALILILGLAACGADDDEVETVDLAAGDSLVIEPEHEPAAGMDRPPGGMGETAQMQDLTGGTVAGEVTVSNRGEQSEVNVRLTGASINGEHPGHVHAGSCSTIGGVVEPLEPIMTDSIGTGSMTTEVDLAPEQIMNGEHLVVYHAPGGQPMSCAEIPLPTSIDASSTI